MGKSCVILFLDVVTAFASMLRQSIFALEEGDEVWIRFLLDCGYTDGDIHAILDTVRYYASWDIDSEGT